MQLKCITEGGLGMKLPAAEQILQFFSKKKKQKTAISTPFESFWHVFRPISKNYISKIWESFERITINCLAPFYLLVKSKTRLNACVLGLNVLSGLVKGGLKPLSPTLVAPLMAIPDQWWYSVLKL